MVVYKNYVERMRALAYERKRGAVPLYISQLPVELVEGIAITRTISSEKRQHVVCSESREA